ncbi:MAG TPA: cell entry protein [Deltaproteobacteria bacterium]|nr:cell entry protein [Deltaproteobacteria bacterium]
MSMRVNKTAIGLFVVGALGLVILGILAIGSGRFLRERPTYVMFFSGSVNGLRVGAPVLFRGVPVGTVTEIRMRVNPKDLSVLIPVYVEIGDAKIQTQGSERLPRDVKAQQEMTFQMIKRGLRARLEMQSVVTGLLQVSLDFYPDTTPKVIGVDQRYVEIPTIPAPFQMLAEKVESIPLDEILDRVNQAVDGIQKLVNSPQMQGMAGSMRQAADDARSLIARIDSQVDPMAKSLSSTAGRLEQLAATLDREIPPLTSSLKNTSDQAGIALQKVGTTFSQVQGITDGDSSVVFRLNRAIEELELAARSVRELSDSIDENPQVLLFGRQKAERRRK